MSFFDDASLVMIPSGYKDQKVYSVKPLDGSGDLTFSRASSATRVASNGLIEKVRTNIYPYGSNVLTSHWPFLSAGTTLTQGQTDPNGGTTAMRIQFAAGATNYTYFAYATTANLSITRSVYIKGASAQTIQFADPSGTGAENINITTSWARYDINFPTSGAGTYGIYFQNLSNAAADFTIAFIQIETGDIATDYIATTTAAVSVGPVSGLPRLDYLNSSCPRLLLEPQRSNLARFSEQFNNASGWGGTAVVTANNAVSPDGYTNADQINPSSLSSASLDNSAAPIAITAGTAYTISLFVKNSNFGASDFITFNTTDNIFSELRGRIYPSTQTISNLSATGSPAWSSISSSVVNYGNGWYRYSITATAASNSSSAVTYLTMSKSCWFYGFMFEAGAYATSYIPTLSTSVTRVADAAFKTGISSLIGQTEGVVFIDFNRSYVTGSYDRYIAVDDNFASIYQTGIFILPEPSINGRVYIELRNNNTGVFGYTYNSTTVPRLKIAVAYKNNDIAIYVNGTQMATSTAALSFAHTLQRVAHYSNSEAINQTLLFKTRLTNAQLAELTTL